MDKNIEYLNRITNYIGLSNSKPGYDNKNKIIELMNKEGFTNAEFLTYDHHLAHAASTYYASPIDQQLIITSDGHGGKSFLEKLTVLTTAPKIIKEVNKIVGKVDAIQLRMPTGMGNYLLPYLSIKKPKAMLWVKYAGNWADQNAPLGYKFQKWWLHKNYLKCPVTINGFWPNQPTHCLSFENPCIEEQEQIIGNELLKTKRYDCPLSGIFIGRLETWKGVDRIIESFPVLVKKGITTFHFVGGGEKLNYYRTLLENKNYPMKIVFHDFLNREDISKLMAESHLIFLPSDNEGFPKVIAEGANYGCVPIVSNVSSIPHYINDKNGFLWDIKKNKFNEFIESIDLSSNILSGKSKNVFEMSKLFTFQNYYKRIIELIGSNKYHH